MKNMVALVCLCATLCADQSIEQFNYNLIAQKAARELKPAEQALIEARGGLEDYGEITPDGIEQLLGALQLTSDDVFFDLGSGLGNVAIKVYLETPVKKSVGVELSPARFRLAQLAKQRLSARGELQFGRPLLFLNRTMLEAPLHDATVVFINIPCSTPDFLRKLTYKLSKNLRQGARVVSSCKLIPEDGFALENTLTVPMSWGEAMPLSIYKLL